jgi:hypothetical protein
VALGPGSIPPQGARAFVRELLRGGTAGMSVSAIVDETTGTSELEFTTPCVWMCSDARARLHVWSCDGRHKRIKQPAADEDYFRLFYG